MKTTPKLTASITKYIQDAPKEIQSHLKKIRQAIKDTAPKAEETIAYGMPTFKLNGQSLAHFAGWKTHIGFYPTPTPIEAFKKDLAAYKVTKGAIQFPLDKAMPLTLVKKLVKARMKVILDKPKKK